MNPAAKPLERPAPAPSIGRSFLIVSGRAVEIAIDASRIQDIVPETQWTGAPPLDLLASVAHVAPGGEEARILVVQLGGGVSLPVRAQGALRVDTIATEAILAVPELLAGHARWLSQLVLVEGARPLFILDPDRLQ
jgi:hypothetical protein